MSEVRLRVCEIGPETHESNRDVYQKSMTLSKRWAYCDEYDAMSRPLYDVDPQVAAAIDNESRRQHEGLELIASENFVSEAVLEAMGSVFTNKYAENYPGKRYYGGCEFTDVVE